MKRINLVKIIFTSLLLSALTFSCEVGLGEAVDVNAPEIKIVSPEVSGSVSRQFSITGNASDNYSVSSLTVDVEGSSFTKNFKWDSTGWKQLLNGNWVDYPSAYISGNSKNFDFVIPVDGSVANSGDELTITSRVSDAYGNEGAKVKDERSVVIDIVEPTVSIIEPMRETSSAAAPAFATYVLQNNSVLPKIQNGTFTISGSQREDTRLDYLVVYLDTETTVINPEDHLEDYPVATPLVRKEIHGENLRNWSTTIEPSDFTDQSILAFDRNWDEATKNAGHILRLVTESHDQAGNIEIKSNGWFKYNNGADIPWVTATFGFDTKVEAEVVSNEIYPRCSLQGQAYDDDGIKSISIKVYEVNPDGTYGALVDDRSISSTDLASEGYPTYKAWSINALSETKTVAVRINITDVNGIAGDEIVRYMHITDINPPNVTITSPETGSSVLDACSGAGKFTFSGQVDDDGQVDFVKVVRIKSGNDDDQRIYFDKDYGTSQSDIANMGWRICTGDSAEDAHGNTIWKMQLSNDVVGPDNRHVRTWSTEFNIFSDFGINGDTEKLKNQKFIIIAQDHSGSANIEAFSLLGDVEEPVITIDKLYLNQKIEDDDHRFYLGDEPIELPKPFARNGALVITDKLMVTGTWSDNSTTKWSDKSKHGAFNLKVAGIDQPVIVKTDGTWETSLFVPRDTSVATIEAEFSDWGGNITKKSRSYYVNSSTPVLTRIGANTQDGSYTTTDSNGNPQKIEITMEFNKAVTFGEGSSNPVLVLNMGSGQNVRKAAYKNGNGTSKHVFEYQIQAGDNANPLNVTGIEINGNRWHDQALAYIENLSGNLPTTGGASLGGGRSIIIDTAAPSLESFTLISGEGWNKAGKSIIIQANFSEDVKITPADLSNLKLKFNNGKYSDSATKTGSNTVLFKYLVAQGDAKTTELQIDSVVSSGYTIADIAGNSLTSITTLPNNLPTGTNAVKVDTGIPVVPTIEGLPSVSTVYADNFKFTISGWDTEAAEKKYTLDGKTWRDYDGEVTVSTNGTYTISAKQTDLAGNASDEAAFVSKTLNTNKIISYITSEQADGTYTTDDEIVIKMVCREKIKVDTSNDGSGKPKCYLALTNGYKAYYSSGNNTTELKFKYTVAEGDTCTASKLNVTDFVSGTKTDTNGIDFSNRCNLPAGNNLSDNREIYVVTGSPVIEKLEWDQSGAYPVLKITFSSNVSKKTGKNIVVSQVYSETTGGTTTVRYNAPAVLTKAQYNNFKTADGSKTSNRISDYYEKGVNGRDDLSEKYILKFEYDDNSDAVRQYFRDTALETSGTGASQVKRTVLDIWVPTASSKVVIDSTNKKVMKVTLSDAYTLPVKGAKYTVSVPAGVAVDDQGHENAAMASNCNGNTPVTLNGEEKPVIRVNKAEASISNGKASQPFRAQVKMDCQTPGKTIKYKIDTYETKYKKVTQKLVKNAITNNTVIQPNARATTPSSTGEKTYEKPTTDAKKVYVGSNDNKTSGYKIDIDCYTSSTNHAYDTVYRSVIILRHGTPSVGSDWGSYKTPFGDENSCDTIYIRGGDSESGAATTTGFPLSWNSGDFGRIKMMTAYTGNNQIAVPNSDGSASNTKKDSWVYVSWNITANCYFGFIAGNSNPSDVATKGPTNWCWATCSWVGKKQTYYLQPGTSFYMDHDDDADNLGSGGFAFQGKHLEYRTGGTHSSDGTGGAYVAETTN